MHIRKMLYGAGAASLAAMLSVACGSESDGSRESPLDPGVFDVDARGGSDGDWDGGGEDVTAPSDASNRDATDSATYEDVQPVPVDSGVIQACSAAGLQHSFRGVNTVVMFDRSASLVRGPTGEDNTASRWAPVTTAMKSFFTTSDTFGLSASLHFFPISDGGTSRCQVSDYASPNVALRSLPDNTFRTAIDFQAPNGGSPMRPAMEGAVSFAKNLAKQRPSEKVAIVLVTDGGPNECSSTNENVRQVASSAFQSTPSIPTYVVAVGPETESLHQLAMAGGTQGAVVVAPADPMKASHDLLTKLEALQPPPSCSVSIPAMPVGSKVVDASVKFTPGSGTATNLPYDATCAGAGWRYDNAAAPKSVDLCPSSCNTFRGDKTSRVSVAFICSDVKDGGRDGGIR